MNRLQLISLIFLLLISSIAYSQTDEPVEKFKDKIFFGGGFGMNFGTINYVELSPLVGYKVTDRLSAGIGLTYKYISTRGYYSQDDFKTTIYGGRLFGNYLVTENLFPQVEYEVLSLERRYFDFAGGYPNEGRFFFESFFVGAGYRYPIGQNSYMTIILLYNLNHTANSPYSQPYVWRMGFNF